AVRRAAGWDGRARRSMPAAVAGKRGGAGSAARRRRGVGRWLRQRHGGRHAAGPRVRGGGAVLTFRLECFANEYLPEGGRHLDAVVTVTASGSLPAPAPDEDGLPPVSEVIVLDASGSMDGAKFREARNAAAIAVRMLRPGTRFAVL